MAVDPLTEEWGAYRRAVDGFYGIARVPLAEGRELVAEEVEPADRALDVVAARAERLTAVGVELLDHVGDEDRDRIATRLLAAAATDIAIAGDALRLDPERPELDRELVEASRDVEVYPTEVILGEADAVFGYKSGIGGIAGAAMDADQARLLEECEEALDLMIESAYDPASSFAKGVISTGMGIAGLPSTNPFVHLDRIRNAGKFIKRQAVKLVAAGLRKLVGVAGVTSNKLAREAVDFLEGKALEALHEAATALFKRFLGIAAGRNGAAEETTEAIEAVHPLPPAMSAAVRSDLHRLRTDYAEQMKWTGVIAKVISHAAPFISGLAAPVGPLVVAVLDGVGVGFVVYTLRMKLTGHSVSGKVDGVVTVVERRLSVAT